MTHRADQTIPYIRARTLEWPTLALVFAIYGGWLALTYFWQAIPLWLLIPLAGALLAPYLKGDDGKDDRSGT